MGRKPYNVLAAYLRAADRTLSLNEILAFRETHGGPQSALCCLFLRLAGFLPFNSRVVGNSYLTGIKEG